MDELIFYNSKYTSDEIEALFDGLFNSAGILKSNGYGEITPVDIGEDIQAPTLVGSGAPTSSTVGQLNQLYINIGVPPYSIWICSAISGSTYTWRNITADENVVYAIYNQTTYAQLLDILQVAKKWIFLKVYTDSNTKIHYAPLLRVENNAAAFIFGEQTDTGATLYTCTSSGWTTSAFEYINAHTLIVNSEPTSTTPAIRGTMKVYGDKLYVCTAVNDNGTYTWTKIGGNEYRFDDPNNDGNIEISLGE